MEETIFAKIIKGDIPCYKVYENDYVLAFLDITQTTVGHTLLIPKQCVRDVFEWDEIISVEMGKALPLIAQAMQKAFPTMTGLNILSNNKASAYQTVFHSHFHLIPRYDATDQFAITMQTEVTSFSPEKMQHIARAISEQIVL